jgi:hypothetical protein
MNNSTSAHAAHLILPRLQQAVADSVPIADLRPQHRRNSGCEAANRRDQPHAGASH